MSIQELTKEQGQVAMRVVRETWVGLAVGVLFTALHADLVCGLKETPISLALVMTLISLPASLIAGLLLAGMSLAMPEGGLSASGAVELVLSWLVFFSVGYVQWFVLVPRLLRRARRRSE